MNVVARSHSASEHRRRLDGEGDAGRSSSARLGAAPPVTISAPTRPA